MADKDAVRLAFHILHHSFGPLVAKVARPLLHRGLLTLPQIHRLSLLPPSAVQPLRAALLLLAQHNLLRVTPAAREGGEDSYELSPRAVFDLQRVGRAVEGARARWGDEAAQVVELLAGRGKACLAEVLAGLGGGAGGEGKVETRQVEVEEDEEVSASDADSDDGASSSGSSSSDDSDGDSDSADDSDGGSSGADRKSRSKRSSSSSKKPTRHRRRPPPQRSSRRRGHARDDDDDAAASGSGSDSERDGSGSDESYASDASGGTRKRKRASSSSKDKKSKKAKKDASSSSKKKDRKAKEAKGRKGADKGDKPKKRKTVKRKVLRTVVVAGQGMDKKRAASIERTLLTLLKSSHILPFHPAQLTSPNHLRAALRADELGKLRGVVGPKDRNEAFARAGMRIDEMRAEWADWRRGVKTKKNAPKQTKKQPSKAAGALAGAADEADEIEPSAYFYINYDKFALMMRNELMVKAASDRLNAEASQIVLAMLSVTADSQQSLAQAHSPPVTLHQIVNALPANLKLHRGLYDPSSALSASSSAAELAGAFCQLLAAEDNPTASGAKTQILAKVKGARDASASYALEFEAVCRRLKGRVLDSVVRERWGTDAARVLAVVLKNGKMDEKHISKVAMLAPKDVRVITAALSASSLLELQEVPRSADRAPSRTFYLWHVDLPRAYAAMVSHLYKTMGNLIQRKEVELEKKRGLVERRNRVDVRESGGALLGELDKKEGKELDEKLAKLTLAEMRTDMNVFILRDLPGGPVGSTQVDVFDKR